MELYVFNPSHYEYPSDLTALERKVILLEKLKNMSIYSAKVLNPLAVKDFLSGSGVAFRECGFQKGEKQILDVYFQEVKKFDI